MEIEAYIFITHNERIPPRYRPFYRRIVGIQFVRTDVDSCLHNEPEAYQSIFGELVNTGLYYRGKPVYIQKALLEEISDKLDKGRYIGTGGGLQAAQWAHNKKVIAEELLKRFPEVRRLTAHIWSGGDFSDYKEITFMRD